MVYVRAAEPMVRLLKMACRKIYLACGIQCCPNFFFGLISFALPASLYVEEHVYTYAHISDCVETVYELPLIPNDTASETFLHKFGAVRSVDWSLLLE
jgi:hypothetical protein